MRTLFLNPQSFSKGADPDWTLDLKTTLLTLFVVLTDVTGSATVSWGLKHQGPVIGGSPLVYLRLILDPRVMLGTSLLLVWLLSRSILLGWADLSYVLPITSFTYVLNALAGHYFLGEQIPWPHWTGTVMITSGAVVVGLTRSNTTDVRREAVS